ncbi:MAG TPA: type II secretion system minor pseudopilin GspI [Gammaproteobacteria bacterium]|nr:type II secretion system minor pseudopilin GspI [Gammaproteobacteria bacterium]
MQRQTAGMTLIEVLIALAIIAIALTAVIKAASQNIRGTNYVENKMIALWVGQEVMREVQVGLLSLPQGEEGEAGAMNMLGHDWYWRASEESSANVRIKKLRVRVYEHEPQDGDAQSLIDLDGYRYHAA